MKKRLAILHANCQGEPLARALNASPDFSRAFRLRLYVNYTRQPIPAADLDACALLLYQHLGRDWGDLASAALLERLPRDCPSLCIPNMFFRGPWPLWSGAPGFDYRDVYLDHLLDMGLPERDLLHVYLHSPLRTKFDLDALLGETIARETERQARTPVPYLDFVLENFRRRPLFFTVNHPSQELINLAAAGILKELGMAPADPERLAGFSTGYEDFFLPIHPQAAEAYGLAYGHKGTLYPCYGRTRTFAEYATAYANCRRAGLGDFISFLHVA